MSLESKKTSAKLNTELCSLETNYTQNQTIHSLLPLLLLLSKTLNQIHHRLLKRNRSPIESLLGSTCIKLSLNRFGTSRLSSDSFGKFLEKVVVFGRMKNVEEELRIVSACKRGWGVQLIRSACGRSRTRGGWQGRETQNVPPEAANRLFEASGVTRASM